MLAIRWEAFPRFGSCFVSPKPTWGFEGQAASGVLDLCMALCGKATQVGGFGVVPIPSHRNRGRRMGIQCTIQLGRNSDVFQFDHSGRPLER